MNIYEILELHERLNNKKRGRVKMSSQTQKTPISQPQPKDYLEILALEIARKKEIKGYLKSALEEIKTDTDLKNQLIDMIFDKIFGKNTKIGWWAKLGCKVWLAYRYGL
ncbi:MAG: hypothetical protein DRP74_06590 [Candidatus Omnitrophota bacterium]|nr:MAG: hypothetical protein DRP74_06590 [Candidatus Omnitrophota bacterium]